MIFTEVGALTLVLLVFWWLQAIFSKILEVVKVIKKYHVILGSSMGKMQIFRENFVWGILLIF